MDLQGQEGLMRTFREGWRTRGALAWLIAVGLTAFYTILYFTDLLDPISRAIGFRNKWLFYGLVYTVFMIGGAARYLRVNGNSRYERTRIAVNVGVQLVLAFLLPLVMPLFGGPEFYFSYLWPLDWYKLQPDTLAALPTMLAVYCVVASLIAAPLLAYFYGKRWYCSWVCGCGGLANTFGDPWRHLTSSSRRAWRFERVSIHVVLALAVVSTLLLVVDHALGGRWALHSAVAGGAWWSMRSVYGYVVGSILAGVIGVGVYPLFGPRVWCRNFCPMAALLGLVQKVGRFRVRVKADMCISCGSCTTYCEMGIDVRGYAERGESFTRAACVGCGVCAHVCPRGVLKLENAPSPRRGQRTKKELVVLR